MTYSYRQATWPEKDGIYDLYRLVMNDYISGIWGWNDNWQEMDFEKHFNPEAITVVYKGDKLVGYSHVENDDKRLFLRMMIVHPDHRKNGIGKKLLGAVISSAYEQTKHIRLEVFKINTEAGSFYQNHGFNVIGETPTSYVMGLDF